MTASERDIYHEKLSKLIAQLPFGKLYAIINDHPSGEPECEVIGLLVGFRQVQREIVAVLYPILDLGQTKDDPEGFLHRSPWKLRLIGDPPPSPPPPHFFDVHLFASGQPLARRQVIAEKAKEALLRVVHDYGQRTPTSAIIYCDELRESYTFDVDFPVGQHGVYIRPCA